MTIIRRSDKIQLAQVIPISTLIKSGLGRTQDPEQIAVEKEIERYRDRFFFLQEHYHGLVAAFQMLRPLLKNKALQKRFENERKDKPLSLIVVALFETCILDCYTLLADGDEGNPSLCTLTRPFRNRKDNAKLLDRLASLYSDRHPPWLHPSNIGRFEIALRTGHDPLDPKFGLLAVMPWPYFRT